MAKFNKDSVSGTVTVVVLLSLVCSIVVSGAAVALKSKQDEQKALDVQRNILTVAGLMKEDNASVIKDTYSKFIEPRLVDLQSGDYVQASAEEINKFEPKDAVKDPAKSQAIPSCITNVWPWFMVNHVWFCFCCTRCEYYQRYYLL